MKETVPKQIPAEKKWDHPLYDDAKGGMKRSASNGIFDIFDVDTMRRQGSQYIAKQI